MSKVIFDIETIGEFEALDEDSQQYLLKYAEDEKEKSESKKRTALWPFTGQIVAIGLLNPDTEKGKVYFQAPHQELDTELKKYISNSNGANFIREPRTERSSGTGQAPNEKIKPFSENNIDFKACSEKEILENFWQDVKSYNQFITFNGRGFDCPYLMLRSAVLRTRPTKNLMPPRYSAQQHIDLLDQLTFYGAFRKFTLDFYCRSLGIKSPKIEGMTGEKINQYFNERKYLEIARYCMADVKATGELYQVWNSYVAI